jgi:hypothetical protein
VRTAVTNGQHATPDSEVVISSSFKTPDERPHAGDGLLPLNGRTPRSASDCCGKPPAMDAAIRTTRRPCRHAQVE